MRSAVGRHVCTHCLFDSAKTFDKCPNPNCGVSGLRVYFPSRAEHVRAAQLINMQADGKITGLKFHPRFDLKVEGEKICTYVADSQYYRDGKMILEDVKPPGDFIDGLADLKISLFNAVHKKLGVSIQIYRGG
jgi:hypothetical protein